MNNYQKLRQVDDWLTSQVLATRQPFVGAVFDGVADDVAYAERNDVTDFIYHEITGYQLSYYAHLLNAGSASATVPNEIASNLENQTKTYLLNLLQSNDLISHGYFLRKYQISDTRYSFDNGMILQGLCDSYVRDTNSDLIEPIRHLAAAISNLQLEDGSFPAAKGSRDVSSSFSADNSCLHIKLVIGLLKAAKITRSADAAKAADRLLLWGRSLQQEDGSFISNPRTTLVTTHAFCYALEGYLYAFHSRAESQYLEIVENGVNWLIDHADNLGRLTSGGHVHFRGAFGLSRHLQPLLRWRYWDETVQTGRILHILYKLTNNTAYLTRRDRIVTSLVNLPQGAVINCSGRFQTNPLHKTFTWPNQFASQLLRFVLDDTGAPDALEALF